MTWILDSWQEKPASPDYQQIQSLIDRKTAIIYWHLSSDNLTTFIITNTSDCPLILPGDRRQQAYQFEEWRLKWDSEYQDYATKKIDDNQKRHQHPWRVTLASRLSQLKEILQIDSISNYLPDNINKLILIPHRDLHRFPLHTFFASFTCTYLPSAQIGLQLKNKQPVNQSYVPLLTVEDPATDQQPMHYAQLEAAIIRHLIPLNERISGEDAARETVLKALEKAYTTFHFTGHGYYNSLNPEKSALLLTDGLFTVKDISQLSLSNYHLICLAACETALTGKNGITTEYVGLASAFLKAQSDNVLSTLWTVEEISSTWLMIKFYQHLLAGNSPALALKEAQNWLKTVTWKELANWITQLSQLPSLEQGTVDLLKARADNTFTEGSIIGIDQPTKYSDPYYWTAFTLTGSG